MGSRKQVARFGAVLAGAAITVMGTAFPAFAATTGTVQGTVEDGQNVALDYTDDGKPVEQAVPTSLIGLKLDDQDSKVVPTYCVELTVNTRHGAAMHEAPWDKYPNPNQFQSDRAKVNWVLHNSFPTVKLADLKSKTGISGLNDQEAIAGTQAAIWHFSNGATLAKSEHNEDVTKLYTFLVDPNNNKGIGDEPKPTLVMTPEQLSGHAGDKIGPFTVETTATSGTITVSGPAGIKILDENGNPIPGQTVRQNAVQAHTAGQKAKFFVGVPADLQPGSATVRIDGQATLDEGRLFVGDDKEHATQTLIIAQSEVVKVSAHVTANWTAAPVTTTPTTPAPTTSQVVTPPTTTKPGAPLANTGVSVWPMVGVAGVLLLGGAGALVWQRRRGNV